MSRRKIFELFGSIVIEGTGANKKAMTELGKDIRAANKTLNQLGRDAVKIGKPLTTVTATVLGLSGAVVKLTSDTAAYADQLLDLEQITGLSTDNLQGLEAVALDAGVEFSGLTDTLAQLTTKIPELQTGTGRASESLHQLGIDAYDSSGNFRDMNELFPEIVNKLQDVEDITKRNSISQGLFGESLKSIAPVLSLSKDRFNELFEGAENLSGFMSKEAIDSANKYRIQLEELKREFAGTFRELSSNFIPVLQQTLLPLINDHIIPAIKTLVNGVISLIDWFGEHPIIADFAGAFAAVLLAAGPLLLTFAKFIPLIKSVFALYKALTAAQITLNAVMAANPIGLIVVGIGLLIAAGVALVKNQEVVKEAFINTWDGIKYHFENIADSISLLFGSLILGILEGVNKVGKFIPGLNKGLASLISTVQSGVDTLAAEITVRKALHKEQELSKKLTKEEEKVIESATAATVKSGEVAEEVAEKKKVATLDELEAKKRAAEDALKFEQDAARKSFDISKKLFNEKAKLEEDSLEKVKRSTAEKLRINEFEKTEAIRIATEEGMETAALEALFQAQADVIKAEAKVKEVEAKEKEKEVAAQERVDTLGLITGFANSINAIWTASLNKRTLELETKAEEDRERIQNSVMSEDEKSAAIAKIDSDLDAKKRVLAKENARREKAATLLGIGLATALAITKALPNVPLSVAVGILGTVQLGIAAATPIALAEGGLIRSDGSGSGVIAEVGEGKEDEIVLPMKTGAAELAKNIFGKMKGGGSDFSSKPRSKATEVHNHYHIGTLIADEFGIKKFAKKVNKYTVAEQQRTGAVSA